MRSKIFLIAIVIFLVCLLLEQLKRTKKEGLDKLSIGGLSVAIIGVVIVLISSIFVFKVLISAFSLMILAMIKKYLHIKACLQ